MRITENKTEATRTHKTLQVKVTSSYMFQNVKFYSCKLISWVRGSEPSEHKACKSYYI